MRKIALSFMTIGAMFFATQNLQAQEEEEIEEIETEIEVEVEQDEFASVELADLPQAIKDALATNYNDAVIKEAWVKTKDDKKVYKLKFDLKGEAKKVYIDQDGNWIEKEDKTKSE